MRRALRVFIVDIQKLFWRATVYSASGNNTEEERERKHSTHAAVGAGRYATWAGRGVVGWGVLAGPDSRRVVSLLLLLSASRVTF